MIPGVFMLFFSLADLTRYAIAIIEPKDPSKITLAPVNKKVSENGIVSFFCKASGIPLPDIHWRRAGKRIGPGQSHYVVIGMPMGSVLRIDAAKPRKDDTLFECVAENGVGESAVATVMLEVYADGHVPSGYPQILENPMLKAVEKDRDTDMQCGATGYPEPTITWLKDYIPVNFSDSRVKLLSSGALHISKSLESDEGKYECVAENSVGVVYSYAASLYVRVRRVPPHFSIPPEDVEVIPGGNANLTCVAVGSPMPFVKWRLGALELTAEDDVPVGRNVLVLTDVRESAKYTCVAASDLGNVEEEVQVTVKALPKPPSGLIVSEVTGTSVKLSWNSAPYDESVETYVIHYKQKDSTIVGGHVEELKNIKENEYTVLGLSPCSMYEFYIFAFNNIGRGMASNTLDVLTGESVPSGAPQNFTAIGISSTAVQLHWDPPSLKRRNGEILLYQVLYYQRSNPSAALSINLTNTFMTIERLESMTDFIFQIRAYTAMGPGPWSNRLPFRTFPTMAIPAPTNVQPSWMSSTSLQVSWDPPPVSSIIGYMVYYSDVVDMDMEKWQSVNVGPSTVTELTGLDSFTTYAVRVRANTADRKLSNFSEVAIADKKKKESEDMVKDFRVKTISSATILLEWKEPQKTQGLKHYKIDYIGRKMFLDEQNIEQILIDREKERIVPKEEFTALIEDLVPNTQYMFNISALFLHGWGPTNRLKVVTSVEAPVLVEAPRMLRGISDTSLVIKMFLASEEYGPISHSYVIVVPDELSGHRNPEDFELDDLLGAGGSDDTKAWIAARFDGPLPKEFTLGVQMYAGNSGQFLNRPLTFGKTYRVFIRSVTIENKSASSPYSLPMTTQSGRITFLDSATWRLLWILVPICIAVFILLLAILAILFCSREYGRKKISQTNKVATTPTPKDFPQSSSDPVEIRRQNFHTQGMIHHPPIQVTELVEHIEQLRGNDGKGFVQEFESIETGQQFTWDASNRSANINKNRYANVIAYDHSRVLLQTLDSVADSDYINANYMDGYRKHNSYIATQGPLAHTIGDFWRMVWEQRCPTIVMITKVEERNRVKCEQYWPNRGTEIYGVMRVTLIDLIELAPYTLRTFQISRTCSQEKRDIHQFHFTTWPDHGVPLHSNLILLFVRRVKAMTPLDAGPVVVHCSAGTGRTGVFIVIDSMLERIRHDRTVDIYGHVTCLRVQRNYMVQTEDQYIFIHDALLEAVQSGNTEIAARNLHSHVQKLRVIQNEQTTSGIENEFKKLTSAKPIPSQFVTATLPCNKSKNRLVNIIPYEFNRISLHPIQGIDGSDYINASIVDGYRYRKAYIVTQGPLPETTEDFWRMLWEHNSTIVVMLTKLRENGREKCHQYWPSERSAQYNCFSVDPVAEYNMPQYILREFKITDTRDGQSHTIRQFHFIDWPEQGVPNSGEVFIDFIGQVHKTKEQFGQDGPITVHCSIGVGRTGAFVALSIILERIRYEGIIDVFQTVKMLWMQRAAMIQSQDQYTFCYSAALEYLGSLEVDNFSNC